VGTLAEVAAMSRSTFAEHFVRLVGKSPMDVITAWRMQLARTALERGRVSVADVAQQVGYEAEAAFRKAFKRHFGFGPGEARRG
jgi:AraC-like DNA-binding protein